MEEKRLSLNNIKDACLIIDLSVFRLNAEFTLIGRNRENDCVINEPTISRQHAKIAHENNAFVLYDLDSTTGTFVNNIKIEKKILSTGDIILLGSFPMMFMYEDSNMIQKHDKGTRVISYS